MGGAWFNRKANIVYNPCLAIALDEIFECQPGEGITVHNQLLLPASVRRCGVLYQSGPDAFLIAREPSHVLACDQNLRRGYNPG